MYVRTGKPSAGQKNTHDKYAHSPLNVDAPNTRNVRVKVSLDLSIYCSCIVQEQSSMLVS